ncbi:hypothetical protein LCGC14_1635770 [marine sediment metagenome]|uniref:Ribbon-helix-helix protein CopG domain-containing protein n=1 Tax=marine sediment metagenome TaxID=412755 RepID=A0A0F9L0Q5_9ZZZZ
MARVPKKVAVGTHISMEDKVKLDILKEKTYIKSVSEGIRRAVNEMLKKPEVVMKLNEDINQTKIDNYGNGQKD